ASVQSALQPELSPASSHCSMRGTCVSITPSPQTLSEQSSWQLSSSVLLPSSQSSPTSRTPLPQPWPDLQSAEQPSPALQTFACRSQKKPEAQWVLASQKSLHAAGGLAPAQGPSEVLPSSQISPAA